MAGYIEMKYQVIVSISLSRYYSLEIDRKKNENDTRNNTRREIPSLNLDFERRDYHHRGSILRISWDWEVSLLSAHFRVSAASVERLTFRRESVFILGTCSVEYGDTVQSISYQNIQACELSISRINFETEIYKPYIRLKKQIFEEVQAPFLALLKKETNAPIEFQLMKWLQRVTKNCEYKIEMQAWKRPKKVQFGGSHFEKKYQRDLKFIQKLTTVNIWKKVHLPIGPMGKHQLSVDTVCVDWIVSVLVCAVAVFGVPCFHKKLNIF